MPLLENSVTKRIILTVVNEQEFRIPKETPKPYGKWLDSLITKQFF